MGGAQESFSARLPSAQVPRYARDDTVVEPPHSRGRERMSITEAIILGLVQGLTEFIPVSSTSHLEIVPVVLGWGDPGAAVSAVIQIGTLLAAIIYFFRDIVRLIGGFFRGLITRRPLADVDSREAWLVVIGTIPIVVLGLLLKKHIESTFRGLWIITTMVIVVA